MGVYQFHLGHFSDPDFGRHSQPSSQGKIGPKLALKNSQNTYENSGAKGAAR
jgi:hypothetical protein